MNSPTTSFNVVINGPVANAGSILYLFKTNGINVPKIAATTITVNKEMLTTKPIFTPPKAVPIPKMISDSKTPFRTPTKVSFQILDNIPPMF